jgi:hypothetical protein
MRVIVTAEEIIDRGVWDEFCEKRGINVWAVNEGLMNSDEEFTLSEEEAQSYGFLKK